MQENKSWRGNVIVDFFNFIQTPEECQILCEVSLFCYIYIFDHVLFLGWREVWSFYLDFNDKFWTSGFNSWYQEAIINNALKISLQEGCFLYSSVGEQVPFNDSISGPHDCLCSEQYACTAEEDNQVDSIFSVMKVKLHFKLFFVSCCNVKEEDCQALCLEHSDCQYYTWWVVEVRIEK